MGRELKVEAGTLLAAWPNLPDENFAGSVVLIKQHDEDGAFGWVTNRRTPFFLSDLLPDHPTLGSSDFPVYEGGPVDHTMLQFVHVVPDSIPGGTSLDGRLWIGGELEALGEFLARESSENANRAVRVFLGYSGWGGGQLEAELAERTWIPAAPSMEAIFGPEGDSTWRRVVRSIGEAGDDLLTPPEASWN